MIDLLQQILNFFTTIARYLTSFFENLFLMLSMIPRFIGKIFTFASFVPSWLGIAFGIILAASVILYLLGR